MGGWVKGWGGVIYIGHLILISIYTELRERLDVQDQTT